MEKISVDHKGVKYGLLGLIVFAPLSAGAVYGWSILVIELGALALFVLYKKNKRSSEVFLTGMERGGKYLFFAFLAFLVFQCLPWPSLLVKALSPHSASFQDLFFPGLSPPKFQTISLVPSKTWKSAFELLSYFLVGFLVFYSVKSRRWIDRFILVIFWMGVFQSVYGMIMLFMKNPFILFTKKKYFLDSVTGTFINRNHFSAFMIMVISLSLGLLLSKVNTMQSAGLSWKEKIKRLNAGQKRSFIGLSAGIAAMSAAVLLSKSRSGGVLLIFVFLVFSGLYYLSVRIFRNPSFRLFLHLFLLALICAVLYAGINASINRFSMDKILDEGQRTVWKNTLHIMYDFPLSGTGLGTFSSIYPAYEDYWRPGLYSHVNNDFLEFLSETGFIGLSLLLGSIVLFLISAALIWRARQNPEIKALALGGMTGIFALLVHSLTDFSLHIPAVLVLFSVILALTSAMVRFREPLITNRKPHQETNPNQRTYKNNKPFTKGEESLMEN